MQMLHVVQPDKPATAATATAATAARATACQLYRLTPAWKPAIVFMCHQYDVVQVQVQLQVQVQEKIRRRSVRSDNRVRSRVTIEKEKEKEEEESRDGGHGRGTSNCHVRLPGRDGIISIVSSHRFLAFSLPHPLSVHCSLQSVVYGWGPVNLVIFHDVLIMWLEQRTQSPQSWSTAGVVPFHLWANEAWPVWNGKWPSQWPNGQMARLKSLWLAWVTALDSIGKIDHAQSAVGGACGPSSILAIKKGFEYSKMSDALLAGSGSGFHCL
uniref:HDC05820 n=1 Tax=Drosophila melanogaster TaxID=7227 RepID=Q6IGN9_DROME|nr:TPA_inf: HDC05820 [Drosophila melanogaster]